MAATTTACVVEAVAKAANEPRPAPPASKWYHLTKEREKPLTPGTFLKAAPEKGSIWAFGYPVRHLLQAPVRKATAASRGVPHEFSLVEGTRLVLEKRLLGANREFKGLPVFVGTLGIGYGTWYLAHGLGLPHPWDIHPITLAFERTEKKLTEKERLERERILTGLLENEYLFHSIQEKWKAGKISRAQALQDAEITRLGHNELQLWLSQLRAAADAGEAIDPEDVLDGIIRTPEEDDPLPLRIIPVLHLRQFTDGSWASDALLRKRDPKQGKDFTRLQLMSIYQLEFDKIGALSEAVRHLKAGNDLKQVIQDDGILKRLPDDPYIQHLMRLRPWLGERKFLHLIQEDIDWQFRFAQMRVLGLDMLFPKEQGGEPITLEAIRARVILREGLNPPTPAGKPAPAPVRR